MHKCGEEQRRLAAEWAEFSAQQKLSKERAEREAERALQVDTQREGILVSLAKVGPGAASPVPFLSALTVISIGMGQLSKGHSNSVSELQPPPPSGDSFFLLPECFTHICPFHPHHTPKT